MTAQPATVRRIGIGLIAACAALLTSACAAGQVVQSVQQTPAIDGSNGHVGNVQLHAVAIKTPSVNCYLPGSDAPMTFVIVNQGRNDVTLTGISSPRFSSWVITQNGDEATAYQRADAGTGSCAPQPSGSASSGAAAEPSQPSQQLPKPASNPVIKGGHSLSIGVTQGEDAAGEPVVLLRGLTGGPLYPGEGVQVSFTFSEGGSATFRVPVQLSTVPNTATVPSPSSASSPLE